MKPVFSTMEARMTCSMVTAGTREGRPSDTEPGRGDGCTVARADLQASESLDVPEAHRTAESRGRAGAGRAAFYTLSDITRCRESHFYVQCTLRLQIRERKGQCAR